MRLVHFALTGTMVGGVERYLATLLAGGGPLEHALVYENGDAHPIAGRWPALRAPWSTDAATPVSDLPAGLPDGIPVFHSPPAPAVVARLRAAGGPWGVFCHDHRWWCPSGSRYHANLGAACGIRAGAAACALRYHALGCGSLRPAATVGGFARASAARAALREAPAVLTASSFMRTEAVRHGADPDRVHAAPLPVAPAAGAGGASQDPRAILYASRLTPEKGPFVLLDAFARMRQPARLLLAGAGIAATRVANAARAHPRAADIRLLGELSPEAVGAAMRAAAAVVVPSTWPEPFGLVGVEALAEGRPVVASTIGGIVDWAKDELGVLGVPPGDPQRLAEAMGRVLEEPEWTRHAATAGAAWVADRHDPGAHLRRLWSILVPGGSR